MHRLETGRKGVLNLPMDGKKRWPSKPSSSWSESDPNRRAFSSVCALTDHPIHQRFDAQAAVSNLEQDAELRPLTAS